MLMMQPVLAQKAECSNSRWPGHLWSQAGIRLSKLKTPQKTLNIQLNV